MKTCLTHQAITAAALLLLSAAPLSAQQQYNYTIVSTPTDILGTTPGSGAAGSTVTTPNAPQYWGDWRFSRWLVAGLPTLSPSGPALTQARVVLNQEGLTMNAVYLPSSQDSDGDTIPDWEEWRDFGTLIYNTASNPDGDAFITNVERARAWPPAIVDTATQGGVFRSSSPSIRYRNSTLLYGYTVTSQPPGLLSQSGETAPNSPFTTPNPISEYQGYYFTHWTQDDVRQLAPDGSARTRITTTINHDDTRFVAHFVLKDADSDADGIKDWLEWRYFGSLDLNGTNDADSDSLNNELELTRGYSPRTQDQFNEGGVFRSASTTVNYHDPNDWVYYEIKSQPVGLVAQADLVPTGTVVTTPNLDAETQGYRLAYWTVNGVRQASPNGLAPSRIQIALNADYMQLVAVFVVKDLDSDSDLIPDWLELRTFGDLNKNTSDDPDSDSFTVAHEQGRGYSSVVADTMQEGGVFRSASASVKYRDPLTYKLYTLSSDPEGLFRETTVVPANSEIITPNQYGASQGYTFGFWTVNGLREAAPNGIARTQVKKSASQDINVIGHFTPTSQDSDGDTLPDWYEQFYLGSITLGQTDNPDTDAFDIGYEYLHGLNPSVPDTVQEGGVFRTASKTITVYQPSVHVPYVIRSTPSGLITRQEGLAIPGEVVTSPLLYGVIQGYTFAFWSVNGTRKSSPSGRALNQIQTSVQSATEFVAHYFPENLDSDGDGLKDPYEWAEFGGLQNDSSSNPDADDFTLAQESGRAYPATVKDSMVEGGIFRSASKSVLMQLAAYNVYQPLTVIIDPPGGGFVHGGGNIKQGANARLEAVVPPGVNGVFSHWSGDFSGSANPAFIIMEGPHSVTAHFTVAAYGLKYATTPHGTVTGALEQEVAPGNNGTTVTAVPDLGYHFVQWSDGSTANPRTETNVNAPVDVAATFAINVYQVVFDLGPNGTRTGGGELSQEIVHGEAAIAPEVAPIGYWHFLGWDSAFSSVTAPITVNALYQNLAIVKLSHSHAAFTRPKGKGTIGVTTSHFNLPWTASTTDSWIHLVTGTPGSGNGTVSYTVDAYDGMLPRTATINIGGQTFTILQSAKTAVGQLTAHVTGSGTLSGAKLNTPTPKTVGKTVTLTAKPLKGFRFAGWSGTGFIFAPGAEKRPALTFIMGETVDVTATFEADPFANGLLAGSYAGLVSGADPSDLTANGAVKVTLTKTGTFTCALRAAGGSYTGRGALAADGLGTALVSRKGREPVSLRLQFEDQTDPAPDTVAMEARLASEIGPVLWNSSGIRLYVAPKGGGHPASASYTATAQMTPWDPAFGYGYATVTLSKSGAVRVSGRLPDGIGLTASSAVDLADTWTLFAPLYANKGFVAGQTALSAPPGAGMTAPLHWFKLKVADKVKDNYYRDGFDLSPRFTVERYTPPARYKTAIRVAALVPNVNFEAGGGGLLADPLNRSITLATNTTGTANLFKVPVTSPPDTARLVLTPKGSTGLFTASFYAGFDPLVPTKLIKITGQGVLMQGSNFGGGVFRGPTKAGALELDPIPPVPDP